jgi:hypothetical protein
MSATERVAVFGSRSTLTGCLTIPEIFSGSLTVECIGASIIERL